MINWRDKLIKIADLKLTADYVNSGELKKGDIVYTKEELYDGSGDLQIQPGQPYRVIGLSNKYPGCFCIQTKAGPWWFFFSAGSTEGGGQYFYKKTAEGVKEDANIEDEGLGVERAPERSLEQRTGFIPQTIARILKTKPCKLSELIAIASKSLIDKEFKVKGKPQHYYEFYKENYKEYSGIVIGSINYLFNQGLIARGTGRWRGIIYLPIGAYEKII